MSIAGDTPPRQIVIRERFGIVSIIAGDPRSDHGGEIRVTGPTVEAALQKALNEHGMSVLGREVSIALAGELLETLLREKA